MVTIRTIPTSGIRTHPLGLPFHRLSNIYFTLIRCPLAPVTAA
ncbi:hypothetical protein BY454_1351 [Marinobacter persicus]|uniref:Uncharacterized protein n=1 Tax=Marinobacter persicus TaxID=930118 RepID=A0A2S6G2S9_9GAMM|nr:hypothetical protein BY455_1321 [Marinobacter persicus]PPK52605.1 hypothetical protein B0H24_10331 [Marinobacter persicus]PPK56634.1 hypothetical protein BY454_1351 [Marinobacter persicus]